MVSSKIWLGLLLNENGASYYVDDAGRVRVTNTPRPLKHLPKGWQETEIGFGRSAKYFGLSRTFTTNYQFVKDGAKILRWLYYNVNGVEAKCWFALLKWSDTNGVYNLYYKAEIDFTQVTDDPKIGFDVPLIEGGLTKMLKANENTVYEIDLNDGEAVLDGVLLNDKFNYFVPEQVYTNQLPSQNIALTAAFTNNEGSNINIFQGEQTFEETQDLQTYLATSPNYLIKVVNPTPVTISGSIDVFGSMTSTYEIFFVSTGNSQGFQVFNYVCQISTIDPNFRQTFNFNFTYNLQANDKIYLIRRWTSPPILTLEMGQSGNFSIAFTSRFNTTTAKFIRPLNLLQQLISKATNGVYSAESELLERKDYLVALSGDSLRGLPNAKIKTSIADFFDAYGKILGAALDVRLADEKLLFETKEYFFDNQIQIADIGEVNELNITVAKDQLFSRIRVGYPNTADKEQVAKQSINVGQAYTTAITRLNKELDLVSRYETDCLLIENTRKEFSQKDATDSKSDNSVFVLNIERQPNNEGKYPLFRKGYLSITGVVNGETFFNLDELTPKDLLLANGSYISSSLASLPTSLVRFVSADKNNNLVTTDFNGTAQIQFANVRVSNLNAAYFRPFIFEFKTKAPDNIIDVLRQNTSGYITFTWNGIRLYGFPIEVNSKPIYQDAQEWKLLCSTLTKAEDLALINDISINFDDMGIISHKLPIKLVPLGLSYPLQYHLKRMDVDWHKNRIGRYAMQKPYFQKWQSNDSFKLQFITKGVGVEIDIINCNQQVVDTITMTQVADAAIISPYTLFEGTVDCSTLPQNEALYVYARFGIGAGLREFISEPMLIAADWPTTVLIEASHDANQPDMIFSTKYTTKLRVENSGYKYQPSSKFTSYEDNNLSLELLDGEPSRKYQLVIGGDFGVPDWLIDKVNRMLLLDNVLIDGQALTIEQDAQLEEQEIAGSPYSLYSITLRDKVNRAGTPIDATGIVDNGFSVIYNINTRGFSSTQSPNANQNDNVIQVIDTD